MTYLNNNDHAKWKQHVIDQYPNEACAIVVSGNLILCNNISDNPSSTFRIDPKDYGIALISGALELVLHSHIVDSRADYRLDQRSPSALDLQCWINLDIPFGIVATDGVDVTDILYLDDTKEVDLVGRPFIHGLYDCYSIIRDWHRYKLNINIPNYARDICWWDKNQDLYSDNFAKAGFIEVPQDQIQINDVVLMQVRSPVINHGAVVTDTNTIIHQIFHRLSGYDSLSKWAPTIQKVIRYKELF